MPQDPVFGQKRNCNYCKAADLNSRRCLLGKKVTPGKYLYGALVSLIPEEPCWKPTTNARYVELSLERSNNGEG